MSWGPGIPCQVRVTTNGTRRLLLTSWDENWGCCTLPETNILLMAEIRQQQLRLVVYPIVVGVSYIPGGAAINSST